MEILNEIFSKKQVVDEQGRVYPLHSHTSREQCDFLAHIVETAKPRISLEIGLAYGISTLCILDSLSKNGSQFEHIVIDPFQSDWNNIGLHNIKRSGFSDRVKFYPRFSDQVLASLYAEGRRIGFVYIDSTKVFDILMTDIHFLSKILSIGGILVLDDCNFPSIRLLARFLSQHPLFEIAGGFGKDDKTLKGRIAEYISYGFLKMIPFRKKKLNRINVMNDEDLGVNYRCIAFKKIAEDNRKWDWHSAF